MAQPLPGAAGYLPHVLVLTIRFGQAVSVQKALNLLLAHFIAGYFSNLGIVRSAAQVGGASEAKESPCAPKYLEATGSSAAECSGSDYWTGTAGGSAIPHDIKGATSPDHRHRSPTGRRGAYDPTSAEAQPSTTRWIHIARLALKAQPYDRPTRHRWPPAGPLLLFRSSLEVNRVHSKMGHLQTFSGQETHGEPEPEGGRW